MHLLSPLSDYYEKSDLTMPDARQVPSCAIPEPQRHLLVHSRDMTPTLESACGRTITLRVLNFSLDGDVFWRRILLLPEGADSPLVFGAITIFLNQFPDRARGLVLERKLPLGAILRAQGIAHTSEPDAYFQVTSDKVINHALGLAQPCLLYGRRNVLLNDSRRVLARVLEILPPADGRLGLRE